MATNGTMGLANRNKAGFKRKDLSPTQKKRFDQLKGKNMLKQSANGNYRIKAGALRDLGY